MATTAVAGVTPVFYFLASDKSGYYRVPAAVVWVHCMAVCMPWPPIHEDFWCCGNITCPCFIVVEKVLAALQWELGTPFLHLPSSLLTYGILHGSDS